MIVVTTAHTVVIQEPKLMNPKPLGRARCVRIGIQQFGLFCARSSRVVGLHSLARALLGCVEENRRFPDGPAQAAFDTGTATNELSMYEASRPRSGDSEEEGSWK